MGSYEPYFLLRGIYDNADSPTLAGGRTKNAQRLLRILLRISRLSLLVV